MSSVRRAVRRPSQRRPLGLAPVAWLAAALYVAFLLYPVAQSLLTSFTDRNPLGVKGVGEAGTLGAISAVMSAVNNALSRIGAPAIELPATSEKVWHAVRATHAATGAS